MRNLLLALAAVCGVISLSAQSLLHQRDVIKLETTSFDLSDVRLTGTSPFTHAMEKNGEWLMALEPDRLLSRFLSNAGLEPKAKEYGGWESDDISGHSAGHYLSACAFMYAASGQQKYKDRLDYCVSELAMCQNARPTGILTAMPDDEKMWAEIKNGDVRSKGFDLNGHWVPWYALHKVWKGLVDAYVYGNNEQAKAVVVKMSDWAIDVLSGLDEQKMQSMLVCEIGGMNEAFADVYSITGDKRYLEMAQRFHHKSILDPLAAQRDELSGKHANTQIPKVIGSARIYELTGNDADSTIADYFWNTVVDNHSYANGGNSDHEHFGEPCKLNDRLSTNSSETCNTYNMLRLARELFSWTPRVKYMDYYEKALYNHILASQNAIDGMVCYYIPLLSGGKKAFSSPFDSFWCCVGTGIENHTKYAESIYYKGADGALFINLFIPSVLDWKERKTKIAIDTKYPEQSNIKITISGKSGAFPVKIRYPHWANGATVKVNGQSVAFADKPGSYITLDRKWRSGDVIDVDYPMQVRYESMPDNKNRIAIFYGPTLLSAGLGNKPIDPLEMPVLVLDQKRLGDHVKPVVDSSLRFRLTQPKNDSQKINLMPFYEMANQGHIVYFDIYSESQWLEREKDHKMLMQKQKDLEAITVDVIRLGEMQPERDCNLTGEHTGVGDVGGYKFRHAMDGGWFAFDVKVLPDVAQRMMCSYWGTDKDGRDFDIYIDDRLFVEESLQGGRDAKPYDKFYAIPADFVKGKNKVRVKFQARSGNFAGGVFGFRILK